MHKAMPCGKIEQSYNTIIDHAGKNDVSKVIRGKCWVIIQFSKMIWTYPMIMIRRW